MVNPISGIIGQVGPAMVEPIASGEDFAKRLTDAIDSVNKSQLDADSALTALANGREVDLHGSMIALEKADIALRTMVAVRDRAIGAYEQLMNTTV